MLLQEIEQRLGQALQLARKHNVKPEELVEWHQKLKAELTALLDFSESEERLIRQLRRKSCLCRKCNIQLNNYTKVVAKLQGN